MEQAKAGVFFPVIESNSNLKDEIAALDGLIEAQTQTLKEKLAAGKTLFELESDAARLTELARARRNKKEWLSALSKSAGTGR
jgi:hypothetical protein